jgi:hypothetical protein
MNAAQEGLALSLPSLASMLRVAYESDNPRDTLAAMVRPYAMTAELMRSVSARDVVVNVTHESFLYYGTSFVHMYRTALPPVVYDAPNRALPYVQFGVNDHGVLFVASSHRMPPLRVRIKRTHAQLGEMFPLQVDYFTNGDLEPEVVLSVAVRMDALGVEEDSLVVLEKSSTAGDFAILLCNTSICMCVRTSVGACVRLPVLIHEQHEPHK